MYYGVNISFLQITDNGSLTLFDHQKSDGPLKKKIDLASHREPCQKYSYQTDFIWRQDFSFPSGH